MSDSTQFIGAFRSSVFHTRSYFASTIKLFTSLPFRLGSTNRGIRRGEFKIANQLRDLRKRVSDIRCIERSFSASGEFVHMFTGESINTYRSERFRGGERLRRQAWGLGICRKSSFPKSVVTALAILETARRSVRTSVILRPAR